MKKYKIPIIIALVVLVVTLLIVFIVLIKDDKMTCTMKSDQSANGYVMETKYVVTSNGKNVMKVNITETITSKDKDKLKKFSSQFEEQYKYNKKAYGGYTYKVTNNGNKVISKVTIDYNKMNMKKFIKANVAMKEYTEKDKLTVEGAKKLYESTGATCK